MTVNYQMQRRKLLRDHIAADRAEGARLRKLRETRGVKASWVAAKIGCTPSFLSDLERGNRHWHAHHVEKYLQAIGAE